MNVQIRPDAASSRLTDAGRYVLGMPQLCPNGLSENWLWKELGHRHWNLVAKAFGRASVGFGPAGREPVYAAFRQIALRDGQLGLVRENDALDVRSTLTHLSQTRVVSRHRAEHRERVVADVAMTSVFVRRRIDGVNRSIARVRIDGLSRSPALSNDMSEKDASADDCLRIDGMGNEEHEFGALVFEPCPHLDFNGAGLLYFSSFVAAVDRAEWHILGKDRRLYVTRQRRVMFHANIEVGDALTVRILGKSDQTRRRHRALVTAAADGRLLAEVVTHRVL